MTDRKRDPLPAGYQFGDAGRVPMRIVDGAGATLVIADLEWIAACRRLEKLRPAEGWNVIEGEHH